MNCASLYPIGLLGLRGQEEVGVKKNKKNPPLRNNVDVRPTDGGAEFNKAMGNSFSKEGSDVWRRDDSRRRGYGARRRRRPGSCADTLGALASPSPPQINNKRRRIFNACQRCRKCPVGLSQLETAAYWTQQGGGRRPAWPALRITVAPLTVWCEVTNASVCITAIPPVLQPG